MNKCTLPIIVCIVTIVIVIIILICLVPKEHFSNTLKKMCIIRILGNNLNSVHSDTQTYDNLKFTLENEYEFNNCDKIWILNRIVNPNLQKKYKLLLDKFNKKYLIIPFEQKEYNKIKNKSNVNLDSLKNYYDIFKALYNHSLYLININGARNFGLKYGRKKYLYTFIFDGSCFFTKKQFNTINKELDTKNEYLVLPLLRLETNNLNIDLNKKPTSEPQLGFKNTSTLLFDERLPYGISNKAELLRRLKIPGKWHTWNDNKLILNIDDKPKVDAKTQIISSVCRLSNGTTNQVKLSNDRAIGVLKLVKSIE